MKITSVKDGSHITFQINGSPVTGCWKESSRGIVAYVSDTWSERWHTITEAKEFIAQKASEGYFGPYFMEDRIK